MRLYLIFICFFMFSVLALRADTHYVRPYNEGQANPYTSWDTAGTNIIDVVNAAMTNITPRVVWVSNSVSGGYVLTNQIVITNALTLQSTNGPDVTVINGGFVAGSATTNNRCLVLSNASAVVHGLTFSNGAVCTSTANGDGGGIRMFSGILSNCNIFNNKLFLSAAVSAKGGGIYMSAGTVTACRVAGNMVTNFDATYYGRGGGIATAGSAGCLIINCIISNNVLEGGGSSCFGGGVYLDAGKIQSSIICHNTNKKGDGGGIFLLDKAIMEACTSTVNRVETGSGGGCYMREGMVTNCMISYNYAIFPPVSGNGSGMMIAAEDSTQSNRVFNTTIMGNTNGGVTLFVVGDKNYTNQVINCLIISNTIYGVTMLGRCQSLLNCTVVGNKGIGVRFYGPCGGTVRDCLIAGNSNTYVGNYYTGGGLYIHTICQTGLVSGCTIVSNWYTDAPGSGIRIATTTPASGRLISISSCLIYSNGVSGTDDVFDVASPANTDVLQYSCIGPNNRSQFSGAGIITNNPIFVDFAGGNYRLASGSPCISTGSNEDWMVNAVDLDGNRRLDKFSGIVDMGCYEHVPSGTMYGFR